MTTAEQKKRISKYVREHNVADLAQLVVELEDELKERTGRRTMDRPIQLLVYDESKQAIGVVLHRPGRVEIHPYAAGSAKGKLLVYVYDGTSTDDENEPIGCFDGAEPGNIGWVK